MLSRNDCLRVISKRYDQVERWCNVGWINEPKLVKEKKKKIQNISRDNVHRCRLDSPRKIRAVIQWKLDRGSTINHNLDIDTRTWLSPVGYVSNRNERQRTSRWTPRKKARFARRYAGPRGPRAASSKTVSSTLFHRAAALINQFPMLDNVSVKCSIFLFLPPLLSPSIFNAH